MNDAENQNGHTPPAEEMQKEIRALKRKLELAENNLMRARNVPAAQNRVETILSTSLKKELQFFKLVLENATNVLLLLDFDGRFAYASDTFLREAGIASFGLINGLHFQEVLEPLMARESFNNFAGAVTRAVAQKSTVNLEERIDFNFKGKPLIFSISVTPMTEEDGKTSGIMALFSDITSINDALEAAKQANLAKSEFLANMSHEIRTPMNAIIGMTLIGKSAASSERKDYCFTKIESASNHLLGIINDILDMSKIEAKKFDLSPAEYDFENMLKSVVNVAGFRIEEKKQKFTVNIDKNIPEILTGDDRRMAQVIANLVGNAAKFTPDGGSITLNARLLGEEYGVYTIQIEVTDTGIGISPEQQARLFTSFQQAESSTTRKFGGTGLGLVISKNIVEMMGGKIWMESELGKGSTFAFTIRAAGQAHSEAAQPDVKADAADSTDTEASFDGSRVLLAEDVEINREIVLTLLEPTLLEIDCAENGTEAVRMFCEAPDKYDMIFMDVQMPEMDGYEATRRIRESGALNAMTIPIIAMTANVFREDIEKCLKAGMNGHLGKPLDFDEVLGQLRKYLGKR